MVPGSNRVYRSRWLVYGPAQNQAAPVVPVPGAGNAGEFEHHGAGKRIGQQQASRVMMPVPLFMGTDSRPVLVPSALHVDEIGMIEARKQLARPRARAYRHGKARVDRKSTRLNSSN